MFRQFRLMNPSAQRVRIHFWCHELTIFELWQPNQVEYFFIRRWDASIRATRNFKLCKGWTEFVFLCMIRSAFATNCNLSHKISFEWWFCIQLKNKSMPLTIHLLDGWRTCFHYIIKFFSINQYKYFIDIFIKLSNTPSLSYKVCNTASI